MAAAAVARVPMEEEEHKITSPKTKTEKIQKVKVSFVAAYDLMTTLNGEKPETNRNW